MPGKRTGHLPTSPVTQSERTFCADKYKRLESGSFEMLRGEGESATVEIDATQLAMLLSGVPLHTPRRLRYSRAS